MEVHVEVLVTNSKFLNEPWFKENWKFLFKELLRDIEYHFDLYVRSRMQQQGGFDEFAQSQMSLIKNKMIDPLKRWRQQQRDRGQGGISSMCSCMKKNQKNKKQKTQKKSFFFETSVKIWKKNWRYFVIWLKSSVLVPKKPAKMSSNALQLQLQRRRFQDQVSWFVRSQINFRFWRSCT